MAHKLGQTNGGLVKTKKQIIRRLEYLYRHRDWTSEWEDGEIFALTWAAGLPRDWEPKWFTEWRKEILRDMRQRAEEGAGNHGKMQMSQNSLEYRVSYSNDR